MPDLVFTGEIKNENLQSPEVKKERKSCQISVYGFNK
jgi:hypothetical protein